MAADSEGLYKPQNYCHVYVLLYVCCLYVSHLKYMLSDGSMINCGSIIVFIIPMLLLWKMLTLPVINWIRGAVQFEHLGATVAVIFLFAIQMELNWLSWIISIKQLIQLNWLNMMKCFLFHQTKFHDFEFESTECF